MKKNIVLFGLMLAMGTVLACSGAALAKCSCADNACDCHCTKPCCAQHQQKDACTCKECAKGNHCHCTKDCCKGHQPKDKK